MTQLTIRGVPEADLEVLRELAASKGRSLNSIVRDALAEQAQRERRRRELERALPDLIAFQKRLSEEHGGPFSDSTPLIRADRDR